MPTFVTLSNFTDQGAKTIKDTVKRSEAVKEHARQFGVTMKEIRWTMGAYDVVATWDAPDDASMSAFVLSVAMAGNLHGQTLRAYDAKEMSAVLGKMG